MIWKYELEVRNNVQIFAMPSGGRVLTVQMQRDKLAMWAVVSPSNKHVDRQFLVIGTGIDGWDDLKNWLYIGTAQDRFDLVWHVFEKRTLLE